MLLNMAQTHDGCPLPGEPQRGTESLAACPSKCALSLYVLYHILYILTNSPSISGLELSKDSLTPPFEIQIKCSHNVFRTECRIVTVGAESFLRAIPRPHYLWTPPERGGRSMMIIPVCGPRQRGAGGPRRSSPFDACRNVGQRS